MPPYVEFKTASGVIRVEAEAPAAEQTRAEPGGRGPVRLFLSFAERDRDALTELEQALGLLAREGLAQSWHAQKIDAGSTVAEETAIEVERAEVALLLVSPSYLARRAEEMERLLMRARQGSLRLVPILLRHAEYAHSPLGGLQPLPRNGRPLLAFRDRASAWLEVSAAVRKLIEDILKERESADRAEKTKESRR